LEKTLAGQAGLIDEAGYKWHVRRHERFKKLSYLLRKSKPDSPLVADIVAQAGLADCEGDSKVMALAYVREQRDDARQALRACKAEIAGDAQLFDFSVSAGEKRELTRRLYAYRSTRLVRVGKREALHSREEIAHKIAFKLSDCSTLLVRRENEKELTSSLSFRNGCHWSGCPICQPIRARSQAQHITAEIARVLDAWGDEAKGGSLAHITLTAANQTNVMDSLRVMDAWRVIQHEKDRKYTRKRNPHAIWLKVPWGWSKFEDHQSKSGSSQWHGHMHLLVWMQGYAGVGKHTGYLTVMEHLHPQTCPQARGITVTGKRGRTRVVSARRTGTGAGVRTITRGRGMHKRIKPTYWEALRWSWLVACRSVGLMVNTRLSQSLRVVASHRELSRDAAGSQLYATAAEIAKYTSKPIDLDKLDGIDGLIELTSALYHRRTINGFGGVSVRPLGIDPDVEHETGDHIREVTYRYRGDRYVPTLDIPWSDEAWAVMLRDLTDHRSRDLVIATYEFARQSVGVQGAQPPAVLETFRNNCPKTVVSESIPDQNESEMTLCKLIYGCENEFLAARLRPVSGV